MMHEHMTHYTHVQQQFNHHSQLHWIYKYPKSFHKLLCTELVLNWYGGQNLLLLMYGKGTELVWWTKFTIVDVWKNVISRLLLF